MKLDVNFTAFSFLDIIISTFKMLVDLKKSKGFMDYHELHFVNCCSACSFEEKFCVLTCKYCIYELCCLPFVDEIKYDSYTRLLENVRHKLTNFYL